MIYTGTRGTALLLHLGLVDARTRKVTVFPGLNVARALGLVGDHLVYVRGDGALMMVPFDPNRRSIGTPVQVGDSIAVRSWDAGAALSESGALVYQRGGSTSQLVRTDLAGKETVLVDSVRPYQHPRFSPDGSRTGTLSIHRAFLQRTGRPGQAAAWRRRGAFGDRRPGTNPPRVPAADPASGARERAALFVHAAFVDDG